MSTGVSGGLPSPLVAPRPNLGIGVGRSDDWASGFAVVMKRRSRRALGRSAGTSQMGRGNRQAVRTVGGVWRLFVRELRGARSVGHPAVLAHRPSILSTIPPKSKVVHNPCSEGIYSGYLFAPPQNVVPPWDR